MGPEADGAPPSSKLCIGCGKDHERGAGCGYERDVVWHGFSKAERLAHVRLFPVMVGLAAASVAVFFLVRPPENPIYLYVGVALPAVVALLFGGFGGRALIEELRKKRFRAISKDERDRALAVFVGGELRYAFGESLKYQPVVVADVEEARVLSSSAALALGDDLARSIDPELAAWLRRDSNDETLLRDPTTEDVRLALVVTMTILGLTAREEIALFVGRYKSWGRGGGKMPATTPGFEVALDAAADANADHPKLERHILASSTHGDASPTALDALVDALVADAGGKEALLASLGADEPDEDLSAVKEAWAHVQREEAELVMRLLQHVLDERPRTIGARAPEPA